MRHTKKEWTKPVIERLDVPEAFDPAGAMTYAKWKACRGLQEKRAERIGENAGKRQRP